LQPDAKAILCNYIPLLNHPLFFLSLGCCFAAIWLKLLDYAHLALSSPRPHNFLQHHNHIIAGILLVAMLAFVASGVQVESELNFVQDPLIYGEMLFWGGGHVLQYAWVQLMLFAWVIMLAHILPDFEASQGVRLIAYVNLLAVLSSPIPYLLYPVTSGDFRELFTWLMAWLSGIAPVLFIIYFVVTRLRKGLCIIPPYRCMISASLWWSLLLFGLGGAFAVMINGINVKIPAHYHGSLLGVTVALMGLTYLLLQTHFQSSSARKLGFWQPALLGIGQVMHIGGLFASGGYGVQRKSPTQSGEAMELADLALRIQSSGGGIAIIGGLLFLIVCYKLWRNKITN
jgi:cytochrome c oxidase subunit I